MTRFHQRRFSRCGLLLLLSLYCSSVYGVRPSEAIQNGEKFLVDLLDPKLNLLPEYRGAKVYWIFHDNYLACKVLATSHPEVSKAIATAMAREGVRKSGKIEILFGEVEQPLPFRKFRFQDLRKTDGKLIRTEVVTDQVLDGWQDYADLLLLACIAEKSQPAARQHWDSAMRLWNDKGFLDAAAKHDHHYSTYKLGLALIAAKSLSPPCEPPKELVARLLSLQDKTGGWITDYDATGKPIGRANVETTCLAILGLESASKR